jgi:hypothetical protein
MSQRKTQVLAAFGVLSFLTLVGATAATSQNTGIDVYNGDIRMHGNNITDVGVVKGIQDNWVNESGDTMSGTLNMGSNEVQFSQGKITFGAGGGGELIFGGNRVSLRSDSDSSDGGPFYCYVDETDGSFNCDGSKNWVHSLNSTYDAYYSSQESPEVRAVYEGNASVENGVANVSLPRHFSGTVSDQRPSLRVQATPHSLATVAVTERTSDYLVIEASSDVDVDFRVTGIREGYEDKQVVRKKEDQSGGGN